MGKFEVVIIIPAFNESTIILPNIDEVANLMAGHLESITYELLVIDDGSTDNMW